MPKVLLVKLSDLEKLPLYMNVTADAVNVTDAEINSTSAIDGKSVKQIAGALNLEQYGLPLPGITNVGGICCDYSGNIFITDTAQHTVFKVTEGGKVNVIAGVRGTAGRNGTKQRVPVSAAVNGGPNRWSASEIAKFNTPRGICCDKSGNLYVADSGNNQIRKITPDGLVDVVAGNGNGTSGLVDAALDPFQSKFNNPSAIAVDNSGVLYVADTGNHAIRRIGAANRISSSVSGGIVMTIAGGASGDDDNCRATNVGGANAIFNAPNGIAVDARGNIFVMDNGNRKIKKIGFSQRGMGGAATTTAAVAQGTSWVYLHSGTGVLGSSLGRTAGKPIGSPMDIDTAAYHCTYSAFPYDAVAVDSFGYLYVVDTYSTIESRLLKVDPNGVPAVICDFSQATANREKVLSVAVSPAQKVFLTVTA